MGAIIILVSAVFAVAGRGTLTPGRVGLAITYALMVSYLLHSSSSTHTKQNMFKGSFLVSFYAKIKKFTKLQPNLFFSEGDFLYSLL